MKNLTGTVVNYSVGQGGFAHFEIVVGSQTYTYVYDCGVSTFFSNSLTKSIEKFTSFKIDVLYLSHLHLDHFSGVRALRERNVRIERIMMPFWDYSTVFLAAYHALKDDFRKTKQLDRTLDLFRRVVQGGVSDVMREFIGEDTECYVLEVGDSDQVVIPVNNNENFGASSFLGDRAKSTAEVYVPISTKDALTTVGIGTANSLTLIPFQTESTYLPRIKMALKDSLGAENDDDTIVLAKLLKKLDERTGVGSWMRSVLQKAAGHASAGRAAVLDLDLNTYSLWLYAEYAGLYRATGITMPSENRSKCSPFPWDPRSPLALLWTGDGTFGTKQLNAAKRVLGVERLERIKVCQIPHHGSRNNFDLGIVDQFVTPCFWHVSHAAENRYGHPDWKIIATLRINGEVVRLPENESDFQLPFEILVV